MGLQIVHAVVKAADVHIERLNGEPVGRFADDLFIDKGEIAVIFAADLRPAIVRQQIRIQRERVADAQTMYD